MSPQIEIMLIASIVAMSCSLVGVFLVIRKLSMISDAISHTVLLGIVGVFIFTKDVSSPWMLLGAIIAGLLTVYAINAIQSTRLVSEEASVGIVFPLMFSIAIVLISRYAGSVHLDTDAVLLGEIAFAPLNRMTIFGFTVPKALVTAIGILTINGLVIKVFFKELKITSFDMVLAATLGFTPAIMNTLLMTLVSLTAVSSFNAVGSILVIAFMIGPPLTANLLTHDLKRLIVLSLLISVVNVILGYQAARILDVSIAGCMAVATGVTFTLVYMFSKESGFITRRINVIQQRQLFDEHVLLFYIDEHPGKTKAEILHSVKFSERSMSRMLGHLLDKNMIRVENETYSLNEFGMKYLVEIEKELFNR